MSVCQCSSPKHNADVLNVLWSITLFRPCSAFFPPAPSCYSTQHQMSNYSFQLASLLSSTQLIIGLLGLPISGLFTNQQNSRSKLFHHITPSVLLFDNLIVSFCLILFCGCGKSRFTSSSSSLWFPFSSNYRGLNKTWHHFSVNNHWLNAHWNGSHDSYPSIIINTHLRS